MKPLSHIIASFSAGAGVWFFTKSLYAGWTCFVSGLVLDVDHIVEYLIHHRSKGITLKKIYQACEQTGRQEGEFKFPKLYLFFHLGELALLLWILSLYTKNIYLLAAALGYTIHLILDWIGNSTYPYSYFMLWRLANNFDSGKFFRNKK